MKRGKKANGGPPGPDAVVWASPEFKTLSEGLKTILNVPKNRVETILAEKKASKDDAKGKAPK